MTVKRRCIIAVAVIAAIVCLAWYGGVQLRRNFDLSMTSPYVYISHGPSGEHEAHILTHGFQDRGYCLLVPAESGKLEVIAELYDVRYVRGVWSRDGSVVSCLGDWKYYRCAYDFKTGQSLVLPLGRTVNHSETELADLSREIENLLKSRGGPDKKTVPEQDIEVQSKKLDWATWSRYSDVMRQSRNSR
jgi:hypothetical protein